MNSKCVVFACLIIAIVTVVGCTSQFKGHKINSNGDLPNPDVTGIPFQLTRPEFTLKVIPKNDDPSKADYEIDVHYVPDSSNRYTITMDPSFLADVGFGLTFDANGYLTDGSASTSERMTPMITALGSLGSALAPLLLLKSTEIPEGLGVAIQKAIEKDDIECVKISNLDKNKSVGKAIKERIYKLVSKSAKDEKFFVSTFHYLDNQEKQCLISAKKNLKDAYVADVFEKSKKAWEDNELSFFTKKYKDVESAEFAEKVNNAVQNEKDTYLIDSIIATINEATVSSSDLKYPMWRAKRDLAKSAHKLLSMKSEPIELLEFFIDMPDKIWKARHVLLLELEIEENETRILKHDSNYRSLEVSNKNLKEEWARTLDVSKEYARVLQLKQLEPIAYSQKLEELNKLLKTIDEARISVISVNKIPKPLAIMPATIIDVKHYYNLSDVKNADDYILVFTPLPETDGTSEQDDMEK